MKMICRHVCLYLFTVSKINVSLWQYLIHGCLNYPTDTVRRFFVQSLGLVQSEVRLITWSVGDVHRLPAGSSPPRSMTTKTDMMIQYQPVLCGDGSGKSLCMASTMRAVCYESNVKCRNIVWRARNHTQIGSRCRGLCFFGSNTEEAKWITEPVGDC